MDTNSMMLITALISILAVSIIAGVAVLSSGGTAKEAVRSGATKGIRGIIGNEQLSATVEARLNAIPQDKREYLLQLIDLATPITDTSQISKDAHQWIRNVLDGNTETGAITFTAPLDAISKSGGIAIVPDSTVSNDVSLAG
jgi:hypothetical protein